MNIHHRVVGPQFQDCKDRRGPGTLKGKLVFVNHTYNVVIRYEKALAERSDPNVDIFGPRRWDVAEDRFWYSFGTARVSGPLGYP